MSLILFYIMLKRELKNLISNLSEDDRKELFLYLKNNFTPEIKKKKELDNYLTILLNNKQKLINDFYVKEIGIFGSFATGENKKGSDIDILVEFDENKKTFSNYMDLKFYLEKHLKKKKIDLVIKTSIRKELKESILCEVIYV